MFEESLHSMLSVHLRHVHDIASGTCVVHNLKECKRRGLLGVKDNHMVTRICLLETVEDNTNLEYQNHAICLIRIVDCQSDRPKFLIPGYCYGTGTKGICGR